MNKFGTSSTQLNYSKHKLCGSDVHSSESTNKKNENMDMLCWNLEYQH